MRPRWLEKNPPAAFAPCTCCRPGRKRRFSEKTLRGITSFLFHVLTSEGGAGHRGFLQSLDPRVKIISGLVLIISISVIHSLSSLFAVLLALHIVSVLTKIRMRAFLARIWVPTSVFGGLLAAPAILNIFVPGDPLVIIWRLSGPVHLGPLHLPVEIAVTSQGITSAATMLLRIGATLSAVVLMSMTTRWNEALVALHILGIPRPFIFILGLTYRYIRLFVTLVEERHMARESRVMKEPDAKTERMAAAAGAGALLGKFVEMSGNVHSAMISRGFDAL